MKELKLKHLLLKEKHLVAVIAQLQYFLATYNKDSLNSPPLKLTKVKNACKMLELELDNISSLVVAEKCALRIYTCSIPPIIKSTIRFPTDKIGNKNKQ